MAESEKMELVVKTRIPELAEDNRCEVTFRDIKFCVDIPIPNRARTDPKFQERVILNEVSGRIKSGKLTALMGASGAGKTSLLQVLAGETHIGRIFGSVMINGKTVDQKTIKDLTGFVFQDDVILGTMTVREAITMSATLRIAEKISKEDIDKKVDNMIKIFNLDRCQNTLIGSNVIKGVSGGERKRCAIAMEMITNPCILFLDEPTSGLDTFTAYSAIKILNELAHSGRTVVATLHQPSADIFFMFDDLILLADGKIIYQGPTKEAIPYFAKYDYVCPDYTNPAGMFFKIKIIIDFIFLRILNNEDNSHIVGAENNRERVKKMLDVWAGSSEQASLTKELDNIQPHDIYAASFKKRAPFFTSFVFLFKRASKNTFRNPLILRAKLGQTLVISLIIGLLYLNTQDRTDFSGIQDRIGVLFFLAINNVFSAAVGTLSIFAFEKKVFTREHGGGYYTLPAYFSSKFMVEMPEQICFPFLMGTIVYWMTGLDPEASKYFIMLALIMLCSLCGFSIGVTVASIFESLPTALAVTPILLMPLMLFSGLFVNENSIPIFLNWIKYISPMKYGFEGLALNEFLDGDKTFPINSTYRIPGSQEIADLGFADDGLTSGYCALILIAMVVILITIAYYELSRLVDANSKSVPIKPLVKDMATVRVAS